MRSMGKTALVLLACLLAAPLAQAQTYEVEVKPTLNDLPVKVETVPMPGMLVVRLSNDGTVKVRCDLRYDASPQPPYRAHVYVDAGKTAEDSFRAKRKWFDVEVEVTCKADEAS